MRIFRWVIFAPVGWILISLADFLSLHLTFMVFSWHPLALAGATLFMYAIEMIFFVVASIAYAFIIPARTKWIGVLVVALPSLINIIVRAFTDNSDYEGWLWIYANLNNAALLLIASISVAPNQKEDE